jgi:hypothetical protein
LEDKGKRLMATSTELDDEKRKNEDLQVGRFMTKLQVNKTKQFTGFMISKTKEKKTNIFWD